MCQLNCVATPSPNLCRCNKKKVLPNSCIAVLDLSGVFLGAPHQDWQSCSGRCEGLATRDEKRHRSDHGLFGFSWFSETTFVDIPFIFLGGCCHQSSMMIIIFQYGSGIRRFQLGGFLWLLDVAKDLDVSG